MKKERSRREVKKGSEMRERREMERSKMKGKRMVEEMNGGGGGGGSRNRIEVERREVKNNEEEEGTDRLL